MKLFFGWLIFFVFLPALLLSALIRWATKRVEQERETHLEGAGLQLRAPDDETAATAILAIVKSGQPLEGHYEVQLLNDETPESDEDSV